MRQKLAKQRGPTSELPEGVTLNIGCRHHSLPSLHSQRWSWLQPGWARIPTGPSEATSCPILSHPIAQQPST